MATLREHRLALANNPRDPYVYEIEHDLDRLCSTLLRHLRTSATFIANPQETKRVLPLIVQKLFDAQDRRPMFHVEGTELPLCWNAPRDWEKDYIKYEWGHLKSINQNPAAAHDIHNLALYSARCNQHIQSSMDIQELMIYGGILAQRVSQVLVNRRKLFDTADWQDCISKLFKSA
jgi:hypothetical protein